MEKVVLFVMTFTVTNLPCFMLCFCQRDFLLEIRSSIFILQWAWAKSLPAFHRFILANLFHLLNWFLFVLKLILIFVIPWVCMTHCYGSYINIWEYSFCLYHGGFFVVKYNVLLFPPYLDCENVLIPPDF